MIIMKKENKKTKGIIMKKTFFKKLFTASIAAITALSVFRGVPTFADDTSATTMATGEANAVVKIRKTLNIAQGITTPNATFTFKFTEKSGTSSNGAPYEKGVNIPDISVTYSKTDNQVNDKIEKTTENIFGNTTYKHAGEYVYDVREDKSGWTAIEKDSKKIDAMRYDERTYEMHVIVKNKANGGVYISSVYFKENKQSNTAKVQPSETGVYNLFDNTYTKDASRDPKPDDPSKVDPTANALTITKKVDGASGDKTKDFHFHIRIQLPSTNKTAAEPIKNIVVQHGNASHELAVVAASESVDYDFTLKHGETFTVTQLPAGSKYTVTETGVPGYTASSVYLTNGTSTNGAAGQLGQDYKVENILLGEKTNNNTVTNKINDVTPTGLLIDNLPFILMIGLGLAGFVVLSKKRREA
ncbi:phosphate-transport permease PitB [Streptococcus oralis subsp. tigurinus]|uniref:Phosphate-transport permease PitB n=1 Tax=Streptococcus oralis subsp. tigurinus TaxID=1077464 RepID=A0A1X1G153_STROR|nr:MULTISPECIES: FctA domain-containing protein [Streptococcus]EUC80331.1 T surface-antigen of pili [Streptococcus sp. SR1]ORO40276.1 phosphate-transport permease PitB [Streptococcus oralis subsp. tigurinus]ORO46698.1 phosphate-transport permease PitB [Streptococcus oralis subsp. tigurinus]